MTKDIIHKIQSEYIVNINILSDKTHLDVNIIQIQIVHLDLIHMTFRRGEAGKHFCLPVNVLENKPIYQPNSAFNS